VPSGAPPTTEGATARVGPDLKRSLDVAVAAAGLLLLAPVMLLAAALVAFEDGRPVLYRQRRVGREARRFELLKFRSMRVNDVPVEALGQPSDAHPLLLRSGRALRRLKVDELPQLLNVLRGEMSLVGPRPTIPEQVERYGPFERRRLLVRPGLTGWAQVNGNTLLSWPERIVLDVWYVDHWSLFLDMRILLKTMAVVLLGERRNDVAVKQALAHADGTGRGR
jgi:lipopolysaccharide/colanic/teichoic acid biosynthesis glycosyltransferase